MSEEEKKDKPVETVDDAVKTDQVKKVDEPKAEKSPEVSTSDNPEKAEKTEKKEETAADLLGANIEQVKIFMPHNVNYEVSLL